jgi:hypothetical protein
MKKPRFTDSEKYPHGYRDSKSTDIQITFARVRAEQKKKEEVLQHKLISISRKRTA